MEGGNLMSSDLSGECAAILEESLAAAKKGVEGAEEDILILVYLHRYTGLKKKVHVHIVTESASAGPPSSLFCHFFTAWLWMTVRVESVIENASAGPPAASSVTSSLPGSG
jgi:hypothetical protein